MDAKGLLELAVSQTTEIAMILLDAEGAVVGWMLGSARIFGRGADEMVGRKLHELFTPEDRAAKVPENELEKARRAGTGEDDRWMLRSDGVSFWASGFVQCLRAADGTVCGYVKLLRDRTDIRAQIETLRNRAEQLADEDRRKVLLFGTLAHELRTPLAAIANASELVARAYSDDPKLAYAVQMMQRQSRHVNTLVDNLLELVRARVGKTVLHYERLVLDELLTEVVAMLERELAEKAQRISLLLPPLATELEGDAARLKQAFLNLLQNAVKFSERETEIFVAVTIEADDAVVRIEDQGSGISPNLLPRVFDALTQAEQADSAGSAGLGLGLSLVKEYVELHGGLVQVKSEGLGRGSEFTVRLPLTRRIERREPRG